MTGVSLLFTEDSGLHLIISANEITQGGDCPARGHDVGLTSGWGELETESSHVADEPIDHIPVKTRTPNRCAS